MKIYIGNVEIAGYFMRLKEGFDREGIKADLWFLSNNKYYKVKMPVLVRVNQFLFSAFKKPVGKWGLFVKALLLPFILVFRAFLLIYVSFVYDAFILNSHALFNFYELVWLKFFNKKIIFVCLGTESRPLYLSGNFILSRYINGQKFDYDRCYREVKKQFEEISRIEKYSDWIINHPPTALFHKKPFISWLHIGFPLGSKEIPVKVRSDVSRIVKVLHAPSNNFSKGSLEIENLVNKLEREGLPVSFVKLQNVPNELVLQTIEECDIVIDEIYSDVPLGGLGTEASVAKKLVINAGYYSEHIKEDYPESVIPPSCFCHPDAIENELVHMIKNKQTRMQVADKTHQFLKKNWESQCIAKKYEDILEGNIPKQWIYQAAKLEYIRGYGIHEEKLRQFLKGYIREKGESALFLDHNPAIKDKLLAFIYQ